MKRLWDAIGAVIITALVVKFLFDMIKPYAIWLIIGAIVVLVGTRLYNRQRNW